MTATGPGDLVQLMPYAESLGIELTEATPQRCTGSLAWTAERCTAGGVLHGGVLMSLADSVGAACAFLNLPEGASTSTVESKTNFFRAVRDGSVHATASPLHVGRTFVVVQTDLSDDQGRRVARTTQTQAVVPAAPATG